MKHTPLSQRKGEHDTAFVSKQVFHVQMPLSILCILDKTGVGAVGGSTTNECDSKLPPHTGAVALTCVLWVIFGQYKFFNSMWQVRLLTLHMHTVLQLSFTYNTSY